MMIGIGFIIIEIFDPAFFFVSLGIGAILKIGRASCRERV